MSFETVDDGIELMTEDASPREAKLIDELHTIIRSEWPYYTRDKIECLQPSSGADSVLIIQWEDAGEENLLGGYTDALLKHGWALCGLKNAMTFVAPLTPTLEDDVMFRFEGRSGEVNETYCPKPCDVCDEREYIEHIDVEVDIDVEGRLEADEPIPNYHYRSLRVCDECDLPEEHTEYENEDGEPDFDAAEHPDYDPWGDGE